MRSLPLLLGLVGLAGLVGITSVAAFSPWTVRAPEPSKGECVHESGSTGNADVAWRARLPRLSLCQRVVSAQPEACSMPLPANHHATQHAKHMDKARRRLQRSVLCNIAAALTLRSADSVVAHVHDQST